MADEDNPAADFDERADEAGCCSKLCGVVLYFISILIIICTFPISIFMCVKVSSATALRHVLLQSLPCIFGASFVIITSMFI